MIFGQPESRVLDEEESKTPIFQDLGDRWQNSCALTKLRKNDIPGAFFHSVFPGWSFGTASTGRKRRSS